MTPIYHITHIDNLNDILIDNGLFSDDAIRRKNSRIVNIGYEHIKQRRLNTKIPCLKNITLGQCVPFYFTNRSPMLYAIHKNLVSDYAGGQKNIIYLVALVENIIEKNYLWRFTDGHAVESVTEYFDKWEYRNKIDWKIINSKTWSNTEQDADRKRRKQAEFLIYDFLKWDYIDKIVSIDQKTKSQIEAILSNFPIIKRRPIVIEPNWYY
ncbi:MAG: DUF4433 domain-containing protein [Planctomycetaceae bacterium]|jgi:hypothetical protein|nr:DUF4433 domain-containing protein [Planctomycetaceae bacterium]